MLYRAECFLQYSCMVLLYILLCTPLRDVIMCLSSPLSTSLQLWATDASKSCANCQGCMLPCRHQQHQHHQACMPVGEWDCCPSDSPCGCTRDHLLAGRPDPGWSQQHRPNADQGVSPRRSPLLMPVVAASNIQPSQAMDAQERAYRPGEHHRDIVPLLDGTAHPIQIGWQAMLRPCLPNHCTGTISAAALQGCLS